jgi:hypothetical protein
MAKIEENIYMARGLPKLQELKELGIFIRRPLA